MISVCKLIAHVITCDCLCYVLENKYGLTGAKFWIPYLLIATIVYIVNIWESHK